MDQCTHEVRAEYWKRIIKACSQRPAGQSAKNWMEENGICEQSDYHWQRKFRQQAYDRMKEESPALPAVTEKADVSFVEVPYATPGQTDTKPENGDITPAAVIRWNALRIEITNRISESVLDRILQVLSHA